MPAMTGKSPVLAKLKAKGAAKAFDNVKSNETDYGGGGDLPAGINGGVAQLNDARLGEYKTGDRKGEPFLYLSGVVKKPEDYMGMRASLTMPLMGDPASSRNPKTMEQRLDDALNEMRKLGIETANLSLDDWEAALEALKQEAPHFRFHTWASKPTPEYPNPRSNTQFDGLAKGFQDNGAPGVVDNTTASNGDGTTEAVTEDWTALAEAADGGDTDAQAKIKDACLAAGVTEEAVDATANWTEAVGLLEGAAGDSTDAGGGTEPWKPEVGHFYTFKPKGAKKAVECEVTQVFKETMNLKEVADPKKIHKGVKWTSEPATIDGQSI